jgi:hypothetical protein
MSNSKLKTILTTQDVFGRPYERVSASHTTYSKDDKTVANEFNTFFASIGENTVEQVQRLAEQSNYDSNNHPFVPRQYSQEEQFSFRIVKSEEVENVINSMPTGKAPRNDKITVRVVKHCLPAILPTLTSIINSSFKTEIFPTIWKMAEVRPILKEGDHEVPDHNRSISLLPILSKVCERTALNQFLYDGREGP